MAKVTKAEVLKKLKEHQFSEKNKEKRAELIEAIKNAETESIELVEHKAKVQIGYMEMDVTIEGSRTSSGDISVTTTNTYNHQITSARHVWLIEGDVKVAELYELKNGFSPNAESYRTIDMSSNFYGGYVYRAGNENSASSLIGINYGKETLSKLNLHYRSSKVNAFQFVPETEVYELSYWDIYFTYTTAKGKQKRILVGKVLETNKGVAIEIEFKFEKAKKGFKIPKFVWIILAILAVYLIWNLLIIIS